MKINSIRPVLLGNRPVYSRLLVMLLIAGVSCTVTAGEWRIEPHVTLSETYTDNVELTQSNEDSELITLIQPGVSVSGKGARLRADLKYNMQNYIYADGSDRNDINHSLVADATAELAKDIFFIDVGTSVSQSIVTSDRPLQLDNFNTSGNRQDVVTYNLSPYATHDFGGYFNGFARYAYEIVNYDQSASDSERNLFDIGLQSGRHFSRMRWNVNYKDDTVDQDNNRQDAEFNSVNGGMSYALTRKFHLLAQGGREDNDFQTNETITNGSYWAAGASWMPNRYISLEAMEGNNFASATLGLNPTQRTHLMVNYRDRDVGVNNGAVWSGSFSHYTRRTVWRANYFEDTTTLQQLVDKPLPRSVSNILNSSDLELSTLLFTPPNQWTDTQFNKFNKQYDALTPKGREEFEQDLTDIANDINTGNYFDTTDEVFERKRASVSYSLNTGKSNINISLFSEERRYLESLIEEKNKGVNASWRWRFLPRTNSLLRVGFNQREFTAATQDDDFWFVEAGVTRKMTPNSTGSVKLRRTEQDSSVATKNYEENRVVVQWIVNF